MKILKQLSIITIAILYSLSLIADNNKNIQIGVFDSIPSTIDGGSCVFYKSIKNRQRYKYVMVNNLASLAYIVINNRLIEFTLVEYNDGYYLYKSKNYILEIKLSLPNRQISNESYIITGKMIVKDHYNNYQEIKIYGDCTW